MHRRGIPVVPDFVGGAGGSASMDALFAPDACPDPAAVLDDVAAMVGGLAGEVLEASSARGIPPREAALALAEAARPPLDAKPYGLRLLRHPRFGGNGTPGNPGWIPPGNPWHVDVEQYPFDPAGANRLLDRAGYKKGSDGLRSDPDGKPLRFGLAVASPAPPAVEVVVRALRAIGVEAKPEALDMASFIPRLVKGDTDLSLIMSGGMNTGNEPDYLRTVYSSKTKSVQHAQGYVNPEVDRLAQQQLVTLDEGKRKPMVARIQQIVARDVPVLPLFYPDSFHVLKRSAFDAWYVTPAGVAGSIPLFTNSRRSSRERRPG